MLLTHTNADRARDVTVAVRASVRAWRMSAACMTTRIWLTFSWLTCSWLTCSDMIVLCSTRVITAFLTELGEGKLLGPDSAWQRSLQLQAGAACCTGRGPALWAWLDSIPTLWRSSVGRTRRQLQPG